MKAPSYSSWLNELAERGGFEPPVQGLSPVQQISNLPCSATPAPLRASGPSGRRLRYHGSRGGGRGTRTPKGLRPGAFKAPALPVRLALRAPGPLSPSSDRLLRGAQVGTQLLQQALDQLRVAAGPAVFEVEVDQGAVDVGEADLDERPVSVLPLAHHEHAVGPLQQLAADRRAGELGGASGADLVARVALVEVLGRAAAVDVGGADEQDSLRAQRRPPRKSFYPMRLRTPARGHGLLHWASQ